MHIAGSERRLFAPEMCTPLVQFPELFHLVHPKCYGEITICVREVNSHDVHSLQKHCQCAVSCQLWIVIHNEMAAAILGGLEQVSLSFEAGPIKVDHRSGITAEKE